MKVNIPMDLTVEQAFKILLDVLYVKMDDDPPKFKVENGEIVCEDDDRGELYLALYHLATKIFPNTEFRHLFDNPNTLMNKLYMMKESDGKELTNEQMEFPRTWEEYEKEYGFNDSKEVYTNNSRLILSFRVKQWLDHLSSIQTKTAHWITTRTLMHDGEYYCDKCGCDSPNNKNGTIVLIVEQR